MAVKGRASAWLARRPPRDRLPRSLLWGKPGCWPQPFSLDEPAEGTNLRQKGLELAFEEDDDVKERCVEVRRAPRERGSSLRRYEEDVRGRHRLAGGVNGESPAEYFLYNRCRSRTDQVGAVSASRCEDHLMSNLAWHSVAQPTRQRCDQSGVENPWPRANAQ